MPFGFFRSVSQQSNPRAVDAHGYRPARPWVLLALAILALAPNAAAQRRADLSKLVVIGDSLSAGFQNFSLVASQQEKGYAKVLANQARVEMVLPLISAPGIPGALQLVQVTPFPLVAPTPGMGMPQAPYLPLTNFAVPGAKLGDLLTARPAPNGDVMTNLVLGWPGLGGVYRSQVEWAEAAEPTTLIIWAGSNDALFPPLFEGTPLGITDPVDFRAHFESLVARAAAIPSRPALVVANIPDVTQVAALMTPEKVLEVYGPAMPFLMRAALMALPEGSLLSLSVLSELLANPAQIPNLDRLVLFPLEVHAVRSAVRHYNRIIAETAARHGAALVDVHRLLDRLHRSGYKAQGQKLTTEFLGGLYSLDGVHPTNTGHAIIANEFIKTLNRRLAAGIPPVSVVQVAKEDPLVFRDARGGDDDDEDEDDRDGDD